MFANMTYEDKVAFFDLLDEYFDSRPHLFSATATSPISPQATSSSSSRTLPPASSSAGGRTLPPMAPPTSSNSYRGPPSPSTSTNSGGGGGGGPGGFSYGAAPGEKPDLATRMVLGSFKMGASGASKGLGYLSKNPQAMDALGKMGAATMVNQAKSGIDRSRGKESPQGQGQGQGQEEQQQQPMSPPPTRSRTGSNPPPSRAPPSRAPPKPMAAAAPAADIQAQAVYDYDASDSNDLGVQAGQLVYVIAKTSDDWWTCEDANGQKGLIPSSYLKEL